MLPLLRNETNNKQHNKTKQYKTSCNHNRNRKYGTSYLWSTTRWHRNVYINILHNGPRLHWNNNCSTGFSVPAYDALFSCVVRLPLLIAHFMNAIFARTLFSNLIRRCYLIWTYDTLLHRSLFFYVFILYTMYVDTYLCRSLHIYKYWSRSVFIDDIEIILGKSILFGFPELWLVYRKMASWMMFDIFFSMYSKYIRRSRLIVTDAERSTSIIRIYIFYGALYHMLTSPHYI